MAKIAPTTSSGSFPTMGTSVAQRVNARQPNRGTPVKRTGEEKGGFLESATAVSRPTVYERMGSKLKPTAILYQANAAEAGATGRNVRLLPSAVGNRDFWLKRQYGQVAQ